ncbi:MAG: xanthine dehydrogenase family protein molybdopterin-binding subunit [Alphaproteobacteria bacterium]
MTEQRQAVGCRLPRSEAREKITGAAQYLDDIVRPGMLHAALLQSPYPHARIRSCRTDAARAMRGVRAVVTGDDFPRLGGGSIKDMPCLARGKVRYVGEPVAAVAADTLAIAQAAVQLIEVDYEELPAVLTMEDAVAEAAPLVHENVDGYAKTHPVIHRGNAFSHQEFFEGDVDAAWARCDLVVESEFTTQSQYHNALEPTGAVAEFDASGKVTVWSTTQSVFRVQAELAELLDMPMAKIRAVSLRIGGSFGGKGAAHVQPLAVELARRARRPVKLVLPRAEDFAMMHRRHPARIRVKTGALKDGTLLAREAHVLMDGGAYCTESAEVLGHALLMARGPYNIPNARITGSVVYTNKLRASGFRGFGNPQITFACESQIDEIADRLDLDPFDVRLRNAMRAGDKWLGGQTVAACGLVECIEKVRDAVRQRPRRDPPPRGRRRGIGLACLAHVCGFLSTSASVRLLQDGSITLSTGAVDCGQGSDTALAQICAEALKVEPERVNYVNPDTDASPYNWGTSGSRVTYMVGRAVAAASAQVRDTIFDHAAEMLECAREDLELRPGGIVGIAGVPDRQTTFAAIGRRAHYGVGGPVMGQNALMYDGERFDPKRAVVRGFPFSNLGTYVFGAQAVEVEVDEVTGQVAVVEAWCAHDVGRAINPLAVEGQIHGGFVQGVGFALYEDMVWDGGTLINPTMMDYKVPGAKDVPYAINPIIVEYPEPSGPYGAKAIGEPGLIGVAPAIANAVADAAGVRLRDLPMTPERILTALIERGSDR